MSEPQKEGEQGESNASLTTNFATSGTSSADGYVSAASNAQSCAGSNPGLGKKRKKNKNNGKVEGKGSSGSLPHSFTNVPCVFSPQLESQCEAFPSDGVGRGALHTVGENTSTKKVNVEHRINYNADVFEDMGEKEKKCMMIDLGESLSPRIQEGTNGKGRGSSGEMLPHSAQLDHEVEEGCNAERKKQWGEASSQDCFSSSPHTNPLTSSTLKVKPSGRGRERVGQPLPPPPPPPPESSNIITHSASLGRNNSSKGREGVGGSGGTGKAPSSFAPASFPGVTTGLAQQTNYGGTSYLSHPEGVLGSGSALSSSNRHYSSMTGNPGSGGNRLLHHPHPHPQHHPHHPQQQQQQQQHNMHPLSNEPVESVGVGYSNRPSHGSPPCRGRGGWWSSGADGVGIQQLPYPGIQYPSFPPPPPPPLHPSSSFSSSHNNSSSVIVQNTSVGSGVGGSAGCTVNGGGSLPLHQIPQGGTTGMPMQYPSWGSPSPMGVPPPPSLPPSLPPPPPPPPLSSFPLPSSLCSPEVPRALHPPTACTSSFYQHSPQNEVPAGGEGEVLQSYQRGRGSASTMTGAAMTTTSIMQPTKSKGRGRYHTAAGQYETDVANPGSLPLQPPYPPPPPLQQSSSSYPNFVNPHNDSSSSNNGNNSSNNNKNNNSTAYHNSYGIASDCNQSGHPQGKSFFNPYGSGVGQTSYSSPLPPPPPPLPPSSSSSPMQQMTHSGPVQQHNPPFSSFPGGAAPQPLSGPVMHLLPPPPLHPPNASSDVLQPFHSFPQQPHQGVGPAPDEPAGGVHSTPRLHSPPQGRREGSGTGSFVEGESVVSSMTHGSEDGSSSSSSLPQTLPQHSSCMTSRDLPLQLSFSSCIPASASGKSSLDTPAGGIPMLPYHSSEKRSTPVAFSSTGNSACRGMGTSTTLAIANTSGASSRECRRTETERCSPNLNGSKGEKNITTLPLGKERSASSKKYLHIVDNHEEKNTTHSTSNVDVQSSHHVPVGSKMGNENEYNLSSCLDGDTSSLCTSQSLPAERQAHQQNPQEERAAAPAPSELFCDPLQGSGLGAAHPTGPSPALCAAMNYFGANPHRHHHPVSQPPQFHYLPRHHHDCQTGMVALLKPEHPRPMSRKTTGMSPHNNNHFHSNAEDVKAGVPLLDHSSVPSAKLTNAGGLSSDEVLKVKSVEDGSMEANEVDTKQENNRKRLEEPKPEEGEGIMGPTQRSVLNIDVVEGKVGRVEKVKEEILGGSSVDVDHDHHHDNDHSDTDPTSLAPPSKAKLEYSNTSSCGTSGSMPTPCTGVLGTETTPPLCGISLHPSSSSSDSLVGCVPSTFSNRNVSLLGNDIIVGNAPLSPLLSSSSHPKRTKELEIATGFAPSTLESSGVEKPGSEGVNCEEKKREGDKQGLLSRLAQETIDENNNRTNNSSLNNRNVASSSFVSTLSSTSVSELSKNTTESPERPIMACGAGNAVAASITFTTNTISSATMNNKDEAASANWGKRRTLGKGTTSRSRTPQDEKQHLYLLNKEVAAPPEGVVCAEAHLASPPSYGTSNITSHSRGNHINSTNHKNSIGDNVNTRSISIGMHSNNPASTKNHEKDLSRDVKAHQNTNSTMRMNQELGKHVEAGVAQAHSASLGGPRSGEGPSFLSSGPQPHASISQHYSPPLYPYYGHGQPVHAPYAPPPPPSSAPLNYNGQPQLYPYPSSSSYSQSSFSSFSAGLSLPGGRNNSSSFQGQGMGGGRGGVAAHLPISSMSSGLGSSTVSMKDPRYGPTLHAPPEQLSCTLQRQESNHLTPSPSQTSLSTPGTYPSSPPLYGTRSNVIHPHYPLNVKGKIPTGDSISGDSGSGGSIGDSSLMADAIYVQGRTTSSHGLCAGSNPSFNTHETYSPMLDGRVQSSSFFYSASVGPSHPLQPQPQLAPSLTSSPTTSTTGIHLPHSGFTSSRLQGGNKGGRVEPLLRCTPSSLQLPTPVSFSPFKDCFDGLLKPFLELLSFETLGIETQRETQEFEKNTKKAWQSEVSSTMLAHAPSTASSLNSPGLSSGRKATITTTTTTSVTCPATAVSHPLPSSKVRESLKGPLPTLLRSSSSRMPPSSLDSSTYLTRIGIDGNYFLSQIVFNFGQLDPLWGLHSACPEEILLRVGEFVWNLRERRIEPVFVFQGVGANLDSTRVMNSVMTQPVTPNIFHIPLSVWSELERKKLPPMEELGGETGMGVDVEGVSPLKVTEDIIREVQQYLRRGKFSCSCWRSLTCSSPVCSSFSRLSVLQKGNKACEIEKPEEEESTNRRLHDGPVTCMTAPFLHWSQLVTLHMERYVGLLMGPLDMLLMPYPAMELITNFNFAAEEATWIRRSRVVNALFPRLCVHSVISSPDLESEKVFPGSSSGSAVLPSASTFNGSSPGANRDANGKEKDRRESSTKVTADAITSSVYSPWSATIGDYLLMILGLLRATEPHVNIFPSGCAAAYPLHQLKDILYKWAQEEDIRRVEENVLELIDICEFRQQQRYIVCECGGGAAGGLESIGANSTPCCRSTSGCSGRVSPGAWGGQSSACNSTSLVINSTATTPTAGIPILASNEVLMGSNRQGVRLRQGHDLSRTTSEYMTCLSNSGEDGQATASLPPLRKEFLTNFNSDRKGLSTVLYKKCRDYVLFNTVFSLASSSQILDNDYPIPSVVTHDQIYRSPQKPDGSDNRTAAHSPLFPPALDSFYHVLVRGNVMGGSQRPLSSPEGGETKGTQKEENIQEERKGSRAINSPPYIYFEKYSSLDDVLGDVVPPAILFLQLAGALSVSTVTVATQSYLVNSKPVVDTIEFRGILPILKSFRLQSFCQLLESMISLPTYAPGTLHLPVCGEEEEEMEVSRPIRNLSSLPEANYDVGEEKPLSLRLRLATSAGPKCIPAVACFTANTKGNLHSRTLAWICWSTPQRVVYCPLSGRIRLSEWDLEHMLADYEKTQHSLYLKNKRKCLENGMVSRNDKSSSSAREVEGEKVKENNHSTGRSATTIVAATLNNHDHRNNRGIGEKMNLVTGSPPSMSGPQPLCVSSLTSPPATSPLITVSAVKAVDADERWNELCRRMMSPARVLAVETKYCCIESPYRWTGFSQRYSSFSPQSSASSSLSRFPSFTPLKSLSLTPFAGGQTEKVVEGSEKNGEGTLTSSCYFNNKRPLIDGTGAAGDRTGGRASQVSTPDSRRMFGGVTSPLQCSALEDAIHRGGVQGVGGVPSAVGRKGGNKLYNGRGATILALRLRAFDFMGYLTHFPLNDVDDNIEEEAEEFRTVVGEDEEEVVLQGREASGCAGMVLTNVRDETKEAIERSAGRNENECSPSRREQEEREEKVAHIHSHDAEEISDKNSDVIGREKNGGEAARDTVDASENMTSEMGMETKRKLSRDGQKDVVEDHAKSERREEATRKTSTGSNGDQEEDAMENLSNCSTESGYVSFLFGEHFSFQSLLSTSLSLCSEEFHDGLILCTELVRVHPPVLHGKPYRYYHSSRLSRQCTPSSFSDKLNPGMSPDQTEGSRGQGVAGAADVSSALHTSTLAHEGSSTGSTLAGQHGWSGSSKGILEGEEKDGLPRIASSISRTEDRLAVPRGSYAAPHLASIQHTNSTAAAGGAFSFSSPEEPSHFLRVAQRISVPPPAESESCRPPTPLPPSSRQHPTCNEKPSSKPEDGASSPASSFFSPPSAPSVDATCHSLGNETLESEGYRDGTTLEESTETEELFEDPPDVLLLSRLACLCSLPYSYRIQPSQRVSSKRSQVECQEKGEEGKIEGGTLSSRLYSSFAASSEGKERKEKRTVGDEEEYEEADRLSHDMGTSSGFCAPLTMSTVSGMEPREGNIRRVSCSTAHSSVMMRTATSIPHHDLPPILVCAPAPAPASPPSTVHPSLCSTSLPFPSLDFLTPLEESVNGTDAKQPSDSTILTKEVRMTRRPERKEVKEMEEAENEKNVFLHDIPLPIHTTTNKGDHIYDEKEKKKKVELEEETMGGDRLGTLTGNKMTIMPLNGSVQKAMKRQNEKGKEERREEDSVAHQEDEVTCVDALHVMVENREGGTAGNFCQSGTAGSGNELLPVYRSFRWAPLYSPQLSAFFGVATTLSREMRDMAKCLISAMFLKGVSSCSLREFASFTEADVFPFSKAPMNCIGGLLLHYVLVFPDDYLQGCDTPDKRIHLLSQMFEGILDVRTQLERVMRFVFEGVYLLRAFYYGTSLLKEKFSPTNYPPCNPSVVENKQETGVAQLNCGMVEEDSASSGLAATDFPETPEGPVKILSYLAEDVLESSLGLLKDKWRKHFGEEKAIPTDHFHGIVERAKNWRRMHESEFEIVDA